MKISRKVEPLPSVGSKFMRRLYQQMGWRGGSVFYFAEDSKHSGGGPTPAAAVRDLRLERARHAGYGLWRTK